MIHILNSSVNSNYQAEIIGILAHKSEYFKTTIISYKYLDAPYSRMFYEMQKSYEKHKTVNFQEIMENKEIDKSLFAVCMTYIIHKDEVYFRALEKQAIENYKKRLINNAVIKLNSSDIDVYQFTEGIDKLKSISVDDSKSFDGNTIRDFTLKKHKRLFLNDFPRTSNMLKLYEKDLIFISGKTGTGKTGFVLNLLSDLSKTYPCIYLNLEMAEDKITQRLIGLNTGIELDDLEYCDRLPQSELQKVYDFAKKIDERKSIKMEHSSQTISSVRDIIGSQNQNEHFIVFVDHAGLIGSPGKSPSERMSNTVKALRNLTLDFNCTIFALCQFNRDVGDAKHPSLGLLKDSSEIEQSSRKVLVLWTDDMQNYLLYILKNDSGSLGKISVDYNKKTQKFKELERDLRK